ncbi:hypothetical protein BT93_G0672 [Corymbia citriodora subsp. variegata]|nr:hypothetical protein BT93_G0672 [Corymbia citriodora subsp. variegata]
MIPETLGQLRNLYMLILGMNKFVGTIPISIFNISTMAIFNVADNQLEGGFPSDLGLPLPNLKGIGLSNNHFTGPIPESISNASNLREIEILSNNFSGSVPSFSKMRGLYWFNIGNNSLGSGQSSDLDFLCSLTNSTNLDSLVIDRNIFRGLIPDCIGNLSITLSFFAIKWLTMWGNNISGNIPSQIGNLKKLKMLDISENDFSGQIPESIGNLRMLTKLFLYSNNLRGSIPSSLGNCQNLLLLDLSSNNLSGYIHPKIVSLSSLPIYLDLSQNSLTGPLPGEVGNLKNLGELSLDWNKLSQQIPSSISSCITLESLYLEDNFFEGPLPSTMSSMRGLQLLNVSNNRLSGQIPEFLGSLNLTNLSLTYNDFEGPLPTGGVFRSAISTSVVGNKKLCGGLPDFQLPTCDYKESKQTGISGTAKILISTVSALVGAACILSLLYFFCNLLGVGSFGSVYKGLLDQTQSIMAIKILDLTHHGASKSFIAECEALRTRRELSLLERVNIAIDVACALDYLHHHCETPIVHCDIKPSNVLLDDEMIGHLSDFGLARFLPEATHKLLVNQSSSVGVKGSFGYIAPEYGSGSAVSTEGDVYSFGVLILEMFICKRPTDDMFQNGLNLYRFAKATLIDQVEKVIDPVLLQENQDLEKRQTIAKKGENKSWCSTLECLVSIIEIGVACSSESPGERMDINDALTKLQGIKKKLLDFIVIA